MLLVAKLAIRKFITLIIERSSVSKKSQSITRRAVGCSTFWRFNQRSDERSLPRTFDNYQLKIFRRAVAQRYRNFPRFASPLSLRRRFVRAPGSIDPVSRVFSNTRYERTSASRARVPRWSRGLSRAVNHLAGRREAPSHRKVTQRR